MRNDHQDETPIIPSLQGEMRQPLQRPAMPSAPQKHGNLPLLGLILLLGAAFAVLAWWSQQQLEILSARIVATQDSFARVTEDAAGQLKNISGKVVATESSVTSERENLKLRIKQLEIALQDSNHRLLGVEQQLKELVAQQRQIQELRDAQAHLDTLLPALQAGNEQSLRQLQVLEQQQQRLQQNQESFANQQVEHSHQLAGLQEAGNLHDGIKRLEDELLVLKTALETPSGIQRSEFDNFRNQTVRNLTTLQEQIRTLQYPGR